MADKLDLVTATEAAGMLDIKKQQVGGRIEGMSFPAPAAVLKPRGRVWHRADIVAYKKELERQRGIKQEIKSLQDELKRGQEAKQGETAGR